MLLCTNAVSVGFYVISELVKNQSCSSNVSSVCKMMSVEYVDRDSFDTVQCWRWMVRVFLVT